MQTYDETQSGTDYPFRGSDIGPLLASMVGDLNRNLALNLSVCEPEQDIGRGQQTVAVFEAWKIVAPTGHPTSSPTTG